MQEGNKNKISNGAKEKIQQELKQSLKEKNEIKSSVIKMLLASILNLEIQLKKKEEGLTEDEAQKVVKSEAKKRRDSIEAYEKAGRTDLAKREKEELSILETYLPEEIKDEEIEKIVKEIITETKAKSMQDFGNVMKEVMAKVSGKASGERVSKIVKELLLF